MFAQNAGRLGLLEPQDAEAVVRTYVMAKGHVDAMRQWGRYCEEFDQMGTKFMLELDPKLRNVFLDHGDKLAPFQTPHKDLGTGVTLG